MTQFTRTIFDRQVTFSFRDQSGICTPDANALEVRWADRPNEPFTLVQNMTRLQALRTMAVMINRLNVGFGILFADNQVRLSRRQPGPNDFGLRPVGSSLLRLERQAARRLANAA